MNIVEQPDIFLREPTSEVKFPLSKEDQVIIDTSSDKNSPKIFINPVIEKRAKEKITEEEGCLSCPKKIIEIKRYIYVGLKWFCRHGEEQYKTFYSLPARVVQHEVDHLDGKLIIDLS